MKGAKWFVKFGVALLTLFIVSVINTANIKALSLDSIEDVGFGSASGAFSSTTYSNQVVNATSSGGTLRLTAPTSSTSNTAIELNRFTINLNSPIPAKSILNFSATYTLIGAKTSTGQYIQYRGIHPAGSWALISEDCFQTYKNPNGNEVIVPLQGNTASAASSFSPDQIVLHCNYRAFTSETSTQFVTESTRQVYFGYSDYGQWNNQSIRVEFTSGNSIHVNGDSFTSNDKAFLQQLLQNTSTSGMIQEQQKTNDKLDEQLEQDAQDRQDMQDSVNESESSADDSSAAAESTGTTMLKAFSDFVGALTSASPSDCSLNMNMGNLNLGNVNLCSLSVPAPLQAISSIVLIGFCVPLSLTTAKKIISLFRSFQN